MGSGLDRPRAALSRGASGRCGRAAFDAFDAFAEFDAFFDSEQIAATPALIVRWLLVSMLPARIGIAASFRAQVPV
jgi:hypothetical protein